MADPLYSFAVSKSALRIPHSEFDSGPSLPMAFTVTPGIYHQKNEKHNPEHQ